MIKLIPDSNSKIKDMIFNTNVIAYYKSTCEKYTMGYVNTFITDMQTLITKLGILVANVDKDKPYISKCYTSIKYLCEKVLDNPNLIDTFEDIGLNSKGNENKHAISKNTNIDMQRCVSAYNNLVNRIADKYGLRELEKIIVRKNHQPSNNTKTSNNNFVKSPIQKSQTTQKKTGRPTETQTAKDENLKVKATLKKGEGRYEKGIFNKKEMINFILSISIENQNDLTIQKITAYIKGKDEKPYEKKISKNLDSITEFDLPTDIYGGNIEASIIVVYKIGLFKSKQIKITVSKNF
ncbi:MAG: hypothetical protein IJX17_02270 [Clostridia bacterium]|nr:hypothetical protein [Clostridia bacterium]